MVDDAMGMKLPLALAAASTTITLGAVVDAESNVMVPITADDGLPSNTPRHVVWSVVEPACPLIAASVASKSIFFPPPLTSKMIAPRLLGAEVNNTENVLLPFAAALHVASVALQPSLHAVKNVSAIAASENVNFFIAGYPSREF